MKAPATHKVEFTNRSTGKAETLRFDFTQYKAQSPLWDKYARAVMQPLATALRASGHEVRIITLQGV